MILLGRTPKPHPLRHSRDAEGSQTSTRGPLVTRLNSYHLPLTTPWDWREHHLSSGREEAHTGVRDRFCSPLFLGGAGWVWRHNLSCLGGILTHWDLPIRYWRETGCIRKKPSHRAISRLLTFTTSSSSLLAACCVSSLVLNWEQIWRKERSVFTRKQNSSYVHISVSTHALLWLLWR